MTERPIRAGQASTGISDEPPQRNEKKGADRQGEAQIRKNDFVLLHGHLKITAYAQDTEPYADPAAELLAPFLRIDRW